MTDTTPTTYTLPSWNFAKLQERIAKINKRAAKMNVAPLELVKINEYLRTDPEYLEAVELGVMSHEEAPKIKMIEVQINGIAPKLAGWKFIGTLDHYSVPGQVIVQTVPGESIPKEFHNREAVCDHCNKIRNRVETFVCENEQHEFKQVGRQCLKDFLGHDVTQLAWLLTAIHQLNDDLEGDGFRGGGMRQDYQHEILPVLTLAAGAIRTFGWVSRTTAQNGGGEATASTVSDIIAPSHTAEGHKQSRELREKIGDNEQDKINAEASIAWLNTQEDSNEYMHNLKMIIASGHTTIKMLGYTCSLISTYLRAMDKLNAQKHLHKLNEYVGTVGEKIELNIEVTGSMSFPGYREDQTTTMYKMMDEAGHSLVWFSSGNTDLENGKKYTIKGTVKKQELYKEWKQTTLTRVKVIQEILEEKAVA